MQLQNRVSLTIKLSKPFTFAHPVVLLGGFGDMADTWRWGPQCQVFSSLFPSAVSRPASPETSSLENSRARVVQREGDGRRRVRGDGEKRREERERGEEG